MERAVALARESLHVAQLLAREKDAAYAAAALVRFSVEQGHPGPESEEAMDVLEDDACVAALGSRDRDGIGRQLRVLSGQAEEPLRARLHGLAERLCPTHSAAE